MRCQPGDLAIILNTGRPETAENIGAIVEVQRLHDPGRWIVRSIGRPLAAFHAGTNVIGYDVIIAAPDKDLQPIRGLPQNRTSDIRELSPQELDRVTVTTR